ncbi:MAG: hypothetical protein K5874_07970 [Bacteroidaceae bacterium]|nr:hypothetical protein [Bacteroidaceae bacterium]
MKKILCLLSLLLSLMSCSDELVTSRYSNKYRVRFYFEVNNSTELINIIGSLGQFVTIRPWGGGKVMIALPNSKGSENGTEYALSKVGSQDFEYGLGGFIVGTKNTLNMDGNYEMAAYDLSCPNCDRMSYRLTISDKGIATCEKCKMQFDLNDYGHLCSKGTETDIKRTKLYEYRITFNGSAINIQNH